MFTSMTWTPVGSSAFTINDTTYPVNGWSTTVPNDQTRVRKMQQPGSWPRFNYAEGMEIDIEGHILGTSFTAYVTNRRNFLVAFNIPNTTQTNRKHGTLTVQADGMTETCYCDAQIVSCEAPLNTDFPTASEFRVQLFSFYPSFIGSTSSTDIRL